MEKTTSVPKQLRHFLPFAVNFCFYGILVWIIVSSELPPIKEPVFILRKLLFRGKEAAFKAQNPGLRFSLFKNYRPQGKFVSFLTDFPYDPRHTDSELLQAAQGELTPLVLNAAPTEGTAFLFCSNDNIAEGRAKATGYKILKLLGNGKAIARKIP